MSDAAQWERTVRALETAIAREPGRIDLQINLAGARKMLRKRQEAGR